MTFKDYIGIPIGKYIRVRRASRAAALLRLTKMTVAEISQKLFYDSQQTFTREFKKIFCYTPRQYRINSFWSFKNILGRRSVNGKYPEPQMCYLKEKNVTGKCFDFRELIVYSGVNSKTRWNRIHNALKRNNFITLSNKIPFHENNSNVIARTVVWADDVNSDCEITLTHGLYAHFSFCGTPGDYVEYMYNVYYNSLPLYNLNKRDTYDIEIIRKRKEEIIDCHYYLPIHYDNRMPHDIKMLSENFIPETIQ
ncbi:helix-turn-helix domain-containing protein [Citrobacter braakii]|uniref:helix-turn-helix domain-containing protein n=1 Tax=Citrobacter braakii TaxID=57706 RepID=UPI002A366436|nr:helix-turn-helix domain-containing protein [Citrobacter braakii]